MADERWYTTQDVADLLKVTNQTVRLWLREGRLRGLNLGGRGGWRVKESDLNAFLEGGEGKIAA